MPMIVDTKALVDYCYMYVSKGLIKTGAFGSSDPFYMLSIFGIYGGVPFLHRECTNSLIYEHVSNEMILYIFSAPADYTSLTQLLTFNPSTTRHSVSIPITDDSVFEPTERFIVRLSDITSDINVAIRPTEAVIEIIDDDCKLVV